MADLSVNIGKLGNVESRDDSIGYIWIWTRQFQDFVDLEKIGGIIVKGTTLHHREGNPYPRMAETPMGMLNAVRIAKQRCTLLCRPHLSADQGYPHKYDCKRFRFTSGRLR